MKNAPAPIKQHQGIQESQQPDSTASIKEYATLQAQFALAGHTLTHSNFGFTATKWGLVKFLANPDECRAFLKRVGGKHGI